jgi:hypothetical protein
MKLINKQEIKYLILAGIFILVFFLVIIPIFYTPDMSPILAFLIFNLSVVVFMQFFLKSIIQGKKTFKGAIGIMFLILAFSIISAPLSVNFDGKINTSMFLGNASADYTMSQIYSSFGLTGYSLYVFTYPISFILFLFLSALFIKNFLEEI